MWLVKDNMINKLKQHYCKIILTTIQVAFLGGGHYYLEEFEKTRQVIEKSVDRVEEIGNNVSKATKSLENELNNVKKACKRIL